MQEIQSQNAKQTSFKHEANLIDQKTQCTVSINGTIQDVEYNFDDINKNVTISALGNKYVFSQNVLSKKLDKQLKNETQKCNVLEKFLFKNDQQKQKLAHYMPQMLQNIVDSQKIIQKQQNNREISVVEEDEDDENEDITMADDFMQDIKHIQKINSERITEEAQKLDEYKFKNDDGMIFFKEDKKIVFLQNLAQGGQGKIELAYHFLNRQFYVFKHFFCRNEFEHELQIYNYLSQDKKSNISNYYLPVKNVLEKYQVIILKRGEIDLKTYCKLRNKQNQPLKLHEIAYIFKFILEGQIQFYKKDIFFSDTKPDNLILKFDSTFTYFELNFIDFGGAFSKQFNKNLSYPLFLKFNYFDERMIELKRNQQNLNDSQIQQCEIYTIARTVQSCILGGQVDNVLFQKEKIGQFFQKYGDFLGKEFTLIMKKMLKFEDIPENEYYQNYQQLFDDVEKIQIFNDNILQRKIDDTQQIIKIYKKDLVQQNQEQNQLDQLSIQDLIQKIYSYQSKQLFVEEENTRKYLKDKIREKLKKNDFENNQEKQELIDLQFTNFKDLGKNLQNQDKCKEGIIYQEQAEKYFIEQLDILIKNQSDNEINNGKENKDIQDKNNNYNKEENQKLQSKFYERLIVVNIDLGFSYSKIYETQKSLQSFEEAILYMEKSCLDHYYFTINKNKLFSMLDVYDYDRCIEDTNNLLQKLKNDSTDSRYEYNLILAQCYLKKNDYSKALELIQEFKNKYVDQYPEHVKRFYWQIKVYNIKGESYFNLSDIQKSLQNLIEAIKLSSEIYGSRSLILEDTYKLLGQIYEQQQEFDKAIKAQQNLLQVYKFNQNMTKEQRNSFMKIQKNKILELEANKKKNENQNLLLNDQQELTLQAENQNINKDLEAQNSQKQIQYQNSNKSNLQEGHQSQNKDQNQNYFQIKQDKINSTLVQNNIFDKNNQIGNENSQIVPLNDNQMNPIYKEKIFLKKEKNINNSNKLSLKPLPQRYQRNTPLQQMSNSHKFTLKNISNSEKNFQLGDIILKEGKFYKKQDNKDSRPSSYLNKLKNLDSFQVLINGYFLTIQYRFDEQVQILDIFVNKQKFSFTTQVLFQQIDNFSNNCSQKRQTLQMFNMKEGLNQQIIGYFLPQILQNLIDFTEIEMEQQTKGFKLPLKRQASLVQQQNLQFNSKTENVTRDEEEDDKTIMEDIVKHIYKVVQNKSADLQAKKESYKVQNFDGMSLYKNNKKIVFLQNLGKGGQGKVELAYHYTKRQFLIFKQFNRKDQFLHEVNVYNHLAVLDQNEKNEGDEISQYYMPVIEYIRENHVIVMQRGECDLKTYCHLRYRNKIPLKIGEICYIFSFILEGHMQFHKKQIYFSDTKPDNLVLKLDSNFKNYQLAFIDFGGAYYTGLGYNSYPLFLTPNYFDDQIYQMRLDNLEIGEDIIQQAEIYTIARTIQCCILGGEVGHAYFQKSNVNEFFEKYGNILGDDLTQILMRMLKVNCISKDKYYTSYKQLYEDMQNISIDNNVENLTQEQLLDKIYFFQSKQLLLEENDYRHYLEEKIQKQLEEDNFVDQNEKDQLILLKYTNYKDLGKNLEYQYQFKEGVEYLVKAEQFFYQKLQKDNQKIFQEKVVQLNKDLQYSYSQLEEYDKAMKAADKATRIAKQYDLTQYLPQIQKNKLLTMVQVGSHKDYKECLSQANDIFDEFEKNDNKGRFEISFIQGLCLLKLGKYEQSLEKIEEFQKNFVDVNVEHVGRFNFKIQTLNLKGQNHYKLKNYDLSQKYLNEGLHQSQEIYGENGAISQELCSALGNVYEKKGDFKQAKKFFDKALDIYKTYNFNSNNQIQVQKYKNMKKEAKIIARKDRKQQRLQIKGLNNDDLDTIKEFGSQKSISHSTSPNKKQSNSLDFKQQYYSYQEKQELQKVQRHDSRIQLQKLKVTESQDFTFPQINKSTSALLINSEKAIKQQNLKQDENTENEQVQLSIKLSQPSITSQNVINFDSQFPKVSIGNSQVYNKCKIHDRIFSKNNKLKQEHKKRESSLNSNMTLFKNKSEFNLNVNFREKVVPINLDPQPVYQKKIKSSKQIKNNAFIDIDIINSKTTEINGNLMQQKQNNRKENINTYKLQPLKGINFFNDNISSQLHKIAAYNSFNQDKKIQLPEIYDINFVKKQGGIKKFQNGKFIKKQKCN
ncbi:Protein kinase-like domain [Pseudocohnilembus persalinus]|uniref:Protein kinase-like domain n=1 Tax=Pseudocohnilembus persalinus TaxID=266149 RepID=A0A0V0R3I1_PSEPJ|nr:Protein kinase-like domain [Pseudocohnilembus persalinus]|eukprot:KRX09057.1 Protein kinase-like domain [Pseudocohnilembus persalinus]